MRSQSVLWKPSAGRGILGVCDIFPGGTLGKALLKWIVALTDTEIRKAKPAEKPYRMSNSGSLYLWVTPSGGKLWRWAYHFESK